MSNTHGFGYGVSGAELRVLIAVHGVCPGCVGTGRQWCLHSRSNVPCSVCASGTLATQAHPAPAPLDDATPLAAD